MFQIPYEMASKMSRFNLKWNKHLSPEEMRLSFQISEILLFEWYSRTDIKKARRLTNILSIMILCWLLSAHFDFTINFTFAISKRGQEFRPKFKPKSWPVKLKFIIFSTLPIELVTGFSKVHSTKQKSYRCDNQLITWWTGITRPTGSCNLVTLKTNFAQYKNFVCQVLI